MSSPPTLAQEVLNYLILEPKLVSFSRTSPCVEVHGWALTAVLGSKRVLRLAHRFSQDLGHLQDVSMKVHGGKLPTVIGSKAA